MTKQQIKQLDAGWTKKIKERDKVCKRPNCPYCFNQEGIRYLQSHHIIPRRCWALRWDLKNGVALCRNSHFKWAENDDPEIRAEVNKWYDNTFDMKYLNMRKHNQSKNDYNLIKLYLEEKK